MSQQFEYPLMEDNQFTVQRDDSGELYRERPWGNRLLVMGFGVLLVLGSVWFTYNFYEMGESTAAIAGTVGIGVLGLAGTVAEPVLGDERSRIFERDGAYYVEMMAASRVYLGTLGLYAMLAGPGIAYAIFTEGSSWSTGRRSGIVTLLDAIPLGEVVPLVAGLVIGLLLLNLARKGEIVVYPVD